MCALEITNTTVGNKLLGTDIENNSRLGSSLAISSDGTTLASGAEVADAVSVYFYIRWHSM